MAAAARTLDRVSGDADPRGLVVLAHSLGASMALDAVVRRGLRPGRLVLWDPPLSGGICHAAGPGRRGVRRFRGGLQAEGGRGGVWRGLLRPRWAAA